MLVVYHGSDPFELVNDGDLLLLIERMLRLRGLNTVRFTKVKGHADEGMVLDGQVREPDRLGNNAADVAADYGRGRRVVTCLGFVDVGILSFLTLIGSSLPFLGRWLTMMVEMVLLLTLQFGLLVPSPRGVGWSTRVAQATCYLGF